MHDSNHQIAVLGAGPVGLEAALLGTLHGFDVQVFERGEVAANVRDWGHVRLFSPFGMNASAWGRDALAEQGHKLPSDDAFQTGREFAESYLVPLSRLAALAGRVHEHTRVVAVGRPRLGKGHAIGSAARGDGGFQILLERDRAESTVTADFILDCTGTYPNHNWCGAGGIPCPGEREAGRGLRYDLPDVLGQDRDDYAGSTTLVVGAGYSAATAIASLARLAEEAPATRVIWATRCVSDEPIPRIAGDALPQRDHLAETVNAFARQGDVVEWHRASVVRHIQPMASSRTPRFRVAIESPSDDAGGMLQELTVDRIIANVGYRPDLELARELQVHACYATEGPMKLAASLLGEASADCLKQTFSGVDVLRNPEPGHFVLGAKSYGRNPRFLLRIGHEQVRAVVEELLIASRERERLAP